MGNSVREEVDRRQSENMTTLVHVDGDPTDDCVRDAAEDAYDLVSQDGPILEGWDEIESAPADSAILIEATADELDDTLFEEFREEHEILGTRTWLNRIPKNLVIVSEEIPEADLSAFTFRLKLTDDGPQWHRLYYDVQDDVVFEEVIPGAPRIDE
mgnify:CR=1 FL=1